VKIVKCEKSVEITDNCRQLSTLARIESRNAMNEIGKIRVRNVCLFCALLPSLLRQRILLCTVLLPGTVHRDCRTPCQGGFQQLSTAMITVIFPNEVENDWNFEGERTLPKI
jgi:hypothetical protein